MDEFTERVGGSDTIYQKDWAAVKTTGGLACDAWLPDGDEIGFEDSLPWPKDGGGIIAPSTAKDRYQVQVDMWTAFAKAAKESTSTGYGRLWRAARNISPQWKIKFAPLQNWVKLADLLEDIKHNEGEKVAKERKLMDWLDFEAISLANAENDVGSGQLVWISKNLLGWYGTLMSVGDEQKMMAEQIIKWKSIDGWIRPFPSERKAGKFDAAIFAKPEEKRTLRNPTITNLKSKRPDAKRRDAKTLMGGQSANDVSDSIMYILAWMNELRTSGPRRTFGKRTRRE